MDNGGIQNIMRYLPVPVRRALAQLDEKHQAEIQEIRLRAERPLCITVHGTERVVYASNDGNSTAKQVPLWVTRDMVEQAFQAVCEYSVYRHTKEIREGFITIAGGNRVGIAGSAVYRAGQMMQLRHISSLNFRIAHASHDCALPLVQRVFAVRPQSLLLMGTVGSGKTTMLRDLCRLLGEKWRVSLVDERSEMAAMHGGLPRYEVGTHTDVLDGFPRGEGMLTALRVFTPQVMICDEIGTPEDADAIMQVHGCGVPVIASVHAGSWEELHQRRVLRTLLEAGVFSYIAQLSSTVLGKVETLRQVGT